MRWVNYICRFPFAILVSGVFSIIVYCATIFGMLFLNWNREFESIKTIHNDIGTLYLDVMGLS